jgi:hypothetical protein
MSRQLFLPPLPHQLVSFVLIFIALTGELLSLAQPLSPVTEEIS